MEPPLQPPQAMSIPLIPDSAPFTPLQRAWLNGFLAGLVGGKQLAAAGTADAPVSTAAISGDASADTPWHDPTLPLAERQVLAEGRPLPQRMMAAMAQLDCGQCGYLCHTYAEAIASGAERDLGRCVPGAKETTMALRALAGEIASGGPAAVPPKLNGHAAVTPARTSAPERATAKNPVLGKIVSAQRLTHPDSPKDTRHVVIDIADTGLTYEPGDSLGVLPLNAPALVQDVLEAIEADGSQPVASADGRRKTLREVLTCECALSRVRPALWELLSSRAQEPGERQRLERIVAGETDAAAEGADVVSALAEFPSAKPSVPELLAALGPLQPRLYSISSSLTAHPGQVHLTVGVVRWESQGRERHGVASHFLGLRSRAGDPVPVFVHPGKNFRLPTNPAVPIIMVGPGTGIAPFRAFLQERQSQASRGPAWLLFGNQHFDYDFLYRDDLDAFLADGTLARLDLAFSRDRAEKLYVQHLIVQHGVELWRWLTQGAHVYVCGDAKRMAADVDVALRQVIAEHGNFSAEAARQYLSDLNKQLRYQRDIY